MKLQISFDMSDLERALEIARSVDEYCHIFEIGTLLLYRHGITALEAFTQAFPNKTLLADTKIVDHGKETAQLFGSKEIDWITIMAGAHKDTIQSTCSIAHTTKMKVMLDLLDSNAAGQSAMEAQTMGVDALLVHRPYQEKESTLFIEKWEMIRGNTDLPIFIAGAINRSNIEEILPLNPDGIIIGSAIIKSDNPQTEALYFFEKNTK